MEKSCGGEKPNETVAVFVPEPISKLPDPIFLFQWHPDLRVEVAHNELVEGLLVADDLFRVFAKSI